MTVWCWPLEHVSAVYGRRFLLRHTALEVFFLHGRSAFFNFYSGSVRDNVARRMRKATPSSRAVFSTIPGAMPGLGYV